MTQTLTTYTVLAAWQNHPDGLQEEQREYSATSLAEALTMAERDDAGRPNAPDAYGVLPDDYDLARAEGIEFNDADGLLVDQWSGSPDPADPDNYWIDDVTGERVNAHTGKRETR
jgi:hypothetical protein